MNPRNGANPVPGPIIITGVVDRCGNRIVDFRTNIGTFPFSGFCIARYVVHTPLIGRSPITYCVTTAVIAIRFDSAFGDDDIE